MSVFDDLCGGWCYPPLEQLGPDKEAKWTGWGAGSNILFNIISGPKSYWDFRDTGRWPLYV